MKCLRQYPLARAGCWHFPTRQGSPAGAAGSADAFAVAGLAAAAGLAALGALAGFAVAALGAAAVLVSLLLVSSAMIGRQNRRSALQVKAGGRGADTGSAHPGAR